MPERSFGRTIRYRRTKLGLSPAKLGELVGRSASTIRSWERDTTAPKDDAVILALSAVLDLDKRALFEKAGVDVPAEETSPTVEQALASLGSDRPADTVSDPDEGEADVFVLAEEGSGNPPEVLEEAPGSTTVEEPAKLVALPGRAEVSHEILEEDPELAIAHVGSIEEEDPEALRDRELEEDPDLAIAHVGRATPYDVEDTSAEPEPAPEPGHERSPDTEPAYTTPPSAVVTTVATPPLSEPSYLEDSTQRQIYRVRQMATLAFLVGLVIVLLWSLGNAFESISSWWDEFFGSLRL